MVVADARFLNRGNLYSGNFFILAKLDWCNVTANITTNCNKYSQTGHIKPNRTLLIDNDESAVNLFLQHKIVLFHKTSDKVISDRIFNHRIPYHTDLPLNIFSLQWQNFNIINA